MGACVDKPRREIPPCSSSKSSSTKPDDEFERRRKGERDRGSFAAKTDTSKESSTMITNLASRIDQVDKKLDFIYMNLKQNSSNNIVANDTINKNEETSPEILTENNNNTKTELKNKIDAIDTSGMRRFIVSTPYTSDNSDINNEHLKRDSFVFQTNVNIRILNKELMNKVDENDDEKEIEIDNVNKKGVEQIRKRVFGKDKDIDNDDLIKKLNNNRSASRLFGEDRHLTKSCCLNEDDYDIDYDYDYDDYGSLNDLKLLPTTNNRSNNKISNSTTKNSIINSDEQLGNLLKQRRENNSQKSHKHQQQHIDDEASFSKIEHDMKLRRCHKQQQQQQQNNKESNVDDAAKEEKDETIRSCYNMKKTTAEEERGNKSRNRTSSSNSKIQISDYELDYYVNDDDDDDLIRSKFLNMKEEMRKREGIKIDSSNNNNNTNNYNNNNNESTKIIDYNGGEMNKINNNTGNNIARTNEISQTRIIKTITRTTRRSNKLLVDDPNELIRSEAENNNNRIRKSIDDDDKDSDRKLLLFNQSQSEEMLLPKQRNDDSNKRYYKYRYFEEKRAADNKQVELLSQVEMSEIFEKYESFYDNLDKIEEDEENGGNRKRNSRNININSSNSSIDFTDSDKRSLRIRDSIIYNDEIDVIDQSKISKNNPENKPSEPTMESSELIIAQQQQQQPQQEPKSPGSQEGITIEKLKLQSIIEAVGFLMFPSSSYTYLAFKELLIENNLFDMFRSNFKSDYANLFGDEKATSTLGEEKFHSPEEDIIVGALIGLFRLTSSRDERKIDRSIEGLQKRLGYIYFKYLYNDYEKALRSIGSDMYKFYSNLNSLQESLINHAEFGPRFLYLHEKHTGYSPSYYCLPSTEDFPLFAKRLSHYYQNKENLDSDATTSIDIYVIQEANSMFFYNFFEGLIESTANFLWNLQIRIDKTGMNGLQAMTKSSSKRRSTDSKSSSPCIMGYRVCLMTKCQTTAGYRRFRFNDADLSSNPRDLCINIDLMRATFPFSILIDRNMQIKHIGDGLVRYVGPLIQLGLGTSFLTYFTIVSPKLNEYAFSTILVNHNMSFKLRTNVMEAACKSSQFKDMELKGSVSYLPEVDCLFFIGSPIISSLEELTRREMFISDIPIHDATRDIILVGEQTKAQEGLKFRMEKLKKSIVQAHEDFEQEKQKNIEILNLIFPSEIAKKLWRGEKVGARSVENVSLLYSDIVGFTSICSVSQPIEIIDFLRRLYTEFDSYCGLLDIYKIETIGDAYIVAGGLHKPSEFHCLQVAWMSLLMMEASARNHTPSGTEIKIRVGLHSGEVLAGIVGFKQPRYCLFGNNCAVANKFESLSEEKRVHVSPVTKKLMERFDGFEFERRPNQFLPENWIKKEPDETSWFLNYYKNRDVPKSESCLAHVKAGIKQYKINA